MIDTVNFHDTELVIIVDQNGTRWVAIKPICAAIGISSDAQRKRLRTDARFSCSDITSTGSDGKQYQMACLPISQINGWLYNINPNKVHPDCRMNLLAYQRECQDVLFHHFMPMGGQAEELLAQLKQITLEHTALIMRQEHVEERQDRLERVLGPFLETSASTAGTLLEASKRTKGLRN